MRRVMITMALVGLVSTSLMAQGVREVTLQLPVRTFPEPFSSITGVRQLDDGRLLISDRIEQAVRLLDMAEGSMRDVGRAGSGPGEYQMPAGLLPLPGDSSLLIDFGNMRMSVIAPSGRITRSTSLMHPVAQLVRPTAADADGGLYFEQGGYGVEQGGRVETTNSAPIQRFDFATEAIDTVAEMALPDPGDMPVRRLSSGSAYSQIRGGFDPYPIQNTWTVAPNGDVVIVHADPYHVEWILRDGRRRTGPTIAFTPVSVTDEDKEAWADRMGGGGAVMIGTYGGGGGGGGRSYTMPRPDVDDVEWPETKPAFPREAARVSPSGELWVRRFVAYDAPQTFDVFDRNGNRTHQVILPARRRFVGFGEGTVYAVNVDDDDLQWLEEYTLDRVGN